MINYVSSAADNSLRGCHSLLHIAMNMKCLVAVWLMRHIIYWIVVFLMPLMGRLNQGLAVALDFLSVLVLDRACFFCVNFLVSGCMICLVC